MAKRNKRDDNQNTPDVSDRIGSVDVAEELETAFLEYSLSVLVSRAIPDAADGLKPVQRRLLYAMWKAGIRPEKPHRKSIASVSETLKSYHPHGDQACYQALVRLAQPFSMQLPLVDGHGNMGSLDNPPAAARYTEARLSKSAVELLAEVDEGTVKMRGNFDASTVEPVVLPAAWPALLVEGASGIAVGTTTAIPPHNLAEVVEAVKLRLNKPKSTLRDILELLSGPDFPTGGVVVNPEDLASIYETGNGSFALRARVTVESDGRTNTIVATELPYQVGPEKVVEKVRDLMASGKLPEVASIDDYSDRHNGLQLRIDVADGVAPAAALERLFRLTPMQENVPVNMVALINGRPTQANLMQLLDAYTNHRVEVVRRRSAYRRAKAAKRLNVVDALLSALDHLDEIIDIARNTPKPDLAEKKVAKLLGVDIEAASAVLELSLRRLGSLEQMKLRREQKELNSTIKKLDAVLGSDKKLRALVAEELDAVVADLSIARRTDLGAETVEAMADAIEDTGEILLTSNGDLATSPQARTLTTSKISGPGYVVYSDGWAERVTSTSAAAGPVPASNLHGDVPVSLVEEGRDLVLVHADGSVKRVEGEVVAKTVDSRGASILSTSEYLVVAAFSVSDDDEVAIVTSDAMVLKFPIEQVRPQGAKAAGMAGIKKPESTSVLAAGVATAGKVAAGTSSTSVVVDTKEIDTRNRAGAGQRIPGWKRSDEAVVAWVGPAPKYSKRPNGYGHK